MLPMKRLDRATAALLVLAALLSAAQLVSAFFVHVAARAEPTPSGWMMPATKTYMETFGVSEVILTSVSLAAIVVVAFALRRRRLRAQSGAGWLAWGVSVVPALLGLVGFVYLFGAGVCLLLACVTVPRRHSMATIGASSARPPVEPLKTASP
jgi:uncharacterized membrane protein YhaH (DUF805 family)